MIRLAQLVASAQRYVFFGKIFISSFDIYIKPWKKILCLLYAKLKRRDKALKFETALFSEKKGFWRQYLKTFLFKNFILNSILTFNIA